MKYGRKWLALTLAVVLSLTLTACGSETQSETPAEPEETETTVRIGALKGPTGMGLAYLEEGEGQYELTIAGSPDEINPKLIKGELDVACIPANAAAVLNQQSKGEIVALGINTLGVLYIVEQGESIQTISDLKGKTIVASGKGATPEYALRYLLTENGIDPDKDLTIEWKSEHSECVAALAAGETVAMLPQPFVTVAQSKMEGLRSALDLTAEWAALNNGSQLLTGVVAARKSFLDDHPAAVETLLKDYAASVEQVNSDPAAAAQRIGEMDIVAAPVAEKAIPYCNIVAITGREMKDALSGYLRVLFDAEPKSVGGKLPDEAFYYGA